MASSAESERPVAEIARAITAAYGFIPNLFAQQAPLPASLQAQSALIDAIFVQGKALALSEKRAIVAAIASARGNSYVHALHKDDGPRDGHPALLEFTVKLACNGPSVSAEDVDAVRRAGFSNPAILETISTVAFANMVCTLADGLSPAVDAERKGELLPRQSVASARWNAHFGPYLPSGDDMSAEVASFLRDQYGFVPGVFRAQGLWPELLVAEARVLDLVVFSEDHLSRIQKESILLRVSAVNLNTYGVALHSRMLNVFGIAVEDSDTISGNLEGPSLPAAEKVLLGQVGRLPSLPRETHLRFNSKELADQGFTESQILEAVVTAALGNFLNALQFGLGVPPDFPPRKVFTEKDLYPTERMSRPISDAAPRLDPDGELVARVKAGETDAFEELMRRHTRRVFGTLNGILASRDDARDATQEVFVKAFEHIGRFEGRSKFSTWVMSIAINTGTEILRQRRPDVPLDETAEADFRPRLVMKWAEDPEALFAASQVNALVREAVLRLPQKYRVAVLLRDINQLSTEDSAEALGLSVPALKARVLRGRLMLRESLAAHFVASERTNA